MQNAQLAAAQAAQQLPVLSSGSSAPGISLKPFELEVTTFCPGWCVEPASIAARQNACSVLCRLNALTHPWNNNPPFDSVPEQVPVVMSTVSGSALCHGQLPPSITILPHSVRPPGPQLWFAGPRGLFLLFLCLVRACQPQLDPERGSDQVCRALGSPHPPRLFPLMMPPVSLQT